MKKKKLEAIFIPNQEEKNPSKYWCGSDNLEQQKQVMEERKRRIKNSLKNK